MYQEEMFSKGAFKNATFLDSGCFAQVHAIDDNTVVKYAQRDGTLNWLEWCVMKQAQGEGHPLMPEVYDIVHLEDNRYMVTMKLYRPLPESCHFGDLLWRDHGLDQLTDAGVEHDGARALLDEFGAYFMALSERSYAGWDLHRGNCMLDGQQLVITDPSAAPYYTAPYSSEFTLQ